MNLDKIGKLISVLRKQKGLTQVQLGDMLGISDKSVSKWERGINAPDISLLNPLSDILDISVTELLNGEKNEKEIDIEILKFYNNLTKKQYLKRTILVFFIIVILFSVIFLINNYNRFQVYSISSSREDFVINGYIVFNKEKNILMISKIEYIDSYIGTDKEYIVNEANILLKNKNKVFYNFDGINSEQTLTQYLTGKFIYLDEYKKNNENIMISFDDLKDLTMEIVYYDDEIKNTIIIPLKLTKQYSDTKLFY